MKEYIKKIFNNIFKKHNISIQKFTILFSVISILFNINFITKVYNIYESGLCIFGTIFVLFLLFLIFYSLLFHKYTTKFFTILFLSINVGAVYFINTYNISIDYVMVINVLETNSKEAFELFNFTFLSYVLFFVILPSIYLIKYVNIEYDNKSKLYIKKLITVISSTILILIIVFLNYKKISSGIRENRYLRNDLVPFNYMNSIVKIISIKNKSTDFKDLTNDVLMENENKKNIMIFIVGEAARAKNFSLGGYEINTNEPLNSQDFIYFNNVESCGTSTAVSVPCMFSVYERKDFKMEYKTAISNLLDFMKKAGFYTIWIDNNSDCKGVCNRADEVINLAKMPECQTRVCYDEEMLYDIENKINNINKDNIVIFLHQIGSHGPAYYLRYPEKFEKFSPVCKSGYFDDCSDDEIINAYNNTIYYTSYFINTTINILKDIKDYNTFMLYVSDHGQSLGENGIFLHGTPYVIAPKEQKQVPMILWFSDDFKKNYKIDENCIKNKTNLSHDNLFHSILGIYKINTQYYNKDLDMFNNCYIQ